MAENQREDTSRDDLTEEPSAHKLEESRRKGQVAQSRELSGLLALLAAGVATYASAPHIGAQLLEYMRDVFSSDQFSRVSLLGRPEVGEAFTKALKVMVAAALPICLIGFVLGILGSFAQIGAIFSWDPVTPDMSKVNPLSGFKRLFSKKQLVDGLRVIFKTAILVTVIYLIVKSEVLSSPAKLNGDLMSTVASYKDAAKVMFMALVGILVVFAGIDFAHQKWDYSKNLRMTKQEAKQEHKEREGDPMMKARIRSVQREMARRRMMQAVRKADVIITNPTHIAIAIAYQRDKHAAPKVVAKGADLMAQKIKKIAADAGIPLVENVPLARTLFKTVKIGQYVPRALYQAVAEVLAYVYRLRGRGLS